VGADRSAELEDLPDEATFCARHPQVETYLRCGRCGTPICPRCLIQTPVGARCRECANVSRLPTFNVTPAYFARGMTAAIVSGAAIGAFWAFITDGTSFGGFFIFFIGLGIGWAISEAVSLATNRKRGLGLQICAVLGVGLAYLLYEALGPGTAIHAFSLLAAGIGAVFGASRLKGY
jgi:hypothetical protein